MTTETEVPSPTWKTSGLPVSLTRLVQSWAAFWPRQPRWATAPFALGQQTGQGWGQAWRAPPRGRSQRPLVISLFGWGAFGAVTPSPSANGRVRWQLSPPISEGGGTVGDAPASPSLSSDSHATCGSLYLPVQMCRFWQESDFFHKGFFFFFFGQEVCVFSYCWAVEREAIWQQLHNDSYLQCHVCHYNFFFCSVETQAWISCLLRSFSPHCLPVAAQRKKE